MPYTNLDIMMEHSDKSEHFLQKTDGIFNINV